LVEVPGDPAIGDVQEQQLALQQTGELANVLKHLVIGRRVVQGDKNLEVHGG